MIILNHKLLFTCNKEQFHLFEHFSISLYKALLLKEINIISKWPRPFSPVCCWPVSPWGSWGWSSVWIPWGVSPDSPYWSCCNSGWARSGQSSPVERPPGVDNPSGRNRSTTGPDIASLCFPANTTVRLQTKVTISRLTCLK